MDFPVFQFMLIDSTFTVYSQEDSSSTSFTPPHHIFRHVNNITLSCVFSRLNSPISLRLSSNVRCSKPSTIFMALRWTRSSISISLLNRRTNNRARHSQRASPERRIAERSLLSTCLLPILCLTQPRKLGAAFATHTLLPHGLLGAHQDPWDLLAKAAFQKLSLSLHWCLGLFLSRYKTQHCPSFTRIPSAHLSRLLRPL